LDLSCDVTAVTIASLLQMIITTAKHEWILLIHQLPPKPTSLRVSVWRKLQKLGAISIKNSVYLLPFTEKTHEDFQWLKQEIENDGGEASVFRASSTGPETDEEIIGSFRDLTGGEYARVTADLERLTGSVRAQKRGGHLSAGRLRSFESELERVHAELQRIRETDFFKAQGHAATLRAFQHCQMALRASQDKDDAKTAVTSKKGSHLDPRQYQGRRWVTRSNLHIDRLASAWLIKQFIDKRPRFYFVAEAQRVSGAIAFDMFGAEFTHQGEDCTFETLLKRFSLNDDPALSEIAEIVHDIDLKDNKFNRLEAAGLNVLVNGLAALLKDDRKLLGQCSAVFDGLYAKFSNLPADTKRKKDRGRRQAKPGAEKRPLRSRKK
jgi:hypothetical protein